MPSQANRRSGNKKSWATRNENNKLYAFPLPLLIDSANHDLPFSSASYLLGLFAWFRPRLDNPRCEGVFDPITRSVWVSNPRDKEILWRRGFFGKGNLSRSEPTWHARTTVNRKCCGHRLRLVTNPLLFIRQRQPQNKSGKSGGWNENNLSKTALQHWRKQRLKLRLHSRKGERRRCLQFHPGQHGNRVGLLTLILLIRPTMLTKSYTAKKSRI